MSGEELKYLENIEVEQSYLKSGHFCPNICTGQNPLIWNLKASWFSAENWSGIGEKVREIFRERKTAFQYFNEPSEPLSVLFTTTEYPQAKVSLIKDRNWLGARNLIFIIFYQCLLWFLSKYHLWIMFEHSYCQNHLFNRAHFFLTSSHRWSVYIYVWNW